MAIFIPHHPSPIMLLPSQAEALFMCGIDVSKSETLMIVDCLPEIENQDLISQQIKNNRHDWYRQFEKQNRRKP